MKKNKLIIIIAFILPFSLYNCSDEGNDDEYNNMETARVEIRLTDAPTQFDEVNIDIQSMSINSTDNETSGWREFSLLRPGIYNLLHFRNGADTLLGVHNVPAGDIRQVRLELGSNNYTVKNGFKSHIFAPVGKDEGIIIKVGDRLTANMTYRLWLDFDASRSLVAGGMGSVGPHFLEPVIRPYTENSGGIIEGVVLPPEAKTRVWAILDNDTLFTFPEASGYYRFSGIEPSGEWKIVYDANNLTYYRDEVRDSITVTRGGLTVIPTVRHKI